MNHWQSDCPPLSRGQWGRRSVTIASSWDVFSDQRREKSGQVSITEDDLVWKSWLQNGSEEELVTSGRCCPVPPSHIISIDTTFSAMAITVGALSYSAISQTPPPPQLPNPFHIILQSSSSCSPGLSIFYFPFYSPPLPCPPALSIFSNALPTVQPVSLRFFNSVFYLSHSLTLVRVSPLWQGRSPSHARSCLRFVNGDVM